MENKEGSSGGKFKFLNSKIENCKEKSGIMVYRKIQLRKWFESYQMVIVLAYSKL